MNITRLKEIKKQILVEPSQFDMNTYFNFNKKSTCGTTACIAGWALWLYDPYFREHLDNWETAMDWTKYPDVTAIIHKTEKILEFEYGDHSYGLFNTFFWPDKFRFKYIDAKSREEKAKVAADYIDYVIEDVKKRNRNTKNVKNLV